MKQSGNFCLNVIRFHPFSAWVHWKISMVPFSSFYRLFYFSLVTFFSVIWFVISTFSSTNDEQFSASSRTLNFEEMKFFIGTLEYYHLFLSRPHFHFNSQVENNFFSFGTRCKQEKAERDSENKKCRQFYSCKWVLQVKSALHKLGLFIYERNFSQ